MPARAGPDAPLIHISRLKFGSIPGATTEGIPEKASRGPDDPSLEMVPTFAATGTASYARVVSGHSLRSGGYRKSRIQLVQRCSCLRTDARPDQFEERNCFCLSTRAPSDLGPRARAEAWWDVVIDVVLEAAGDFDRVSGGSNDCNLIDAFGFRRSRSYLRPRLRVSFGVIFQSSWK